LTIRFVGYFICNNFISIVSTARLLIYIEGESGTDTSIKQPLNLKNIYCKTLNRKAAKTLYRKVITINVLPPPYYISIHKVLNNNISTLQFIKMFYITGY